LSSAQPNFFIAGAPKTGTTSLYHYLDQHPEIYMSPVKEANYFAPEVRLENFAEEHRAEMEQDMAALRDYLDSPMPVKRFGAAGLTWEDYLKLFRNADGRKAIGEGSVTYLWSERAARNIFQRIPYAKFIFILRDPADRAFSQYQQAERKGIASASFIETCKQSMKNRDGKFRAFQPFLELGLYADALKRYMDLFPRESLHVAWYEDYQRDAAGMIASILRFLDVDHDFKPDMSKRYLAGAGRPTMAPEDRAFLTEFYQEDVRRLAQLLNRDLSHWTR
jgi:Sulfotransferase family